MRIRAFNVASAALLAFAWTSGPALAEGEAEKCFD